jgi:hypothetical protein
MPSSSGKKPTQLSQLLELVPISGHHNQHKAGYINQTQHKLSMGVKKEFQNGTYMFALDYGVMYFDLSFFYDKTVIYSSSYI